MSRKHIDIKEFRELGLLQEINRRFLHPMGLALAVTEKADGTEALAGVWDNRDDPDGIMYAPHVISPEKTKRVDEMFERKREHREKTLGYHVQPVPT